MPIDHAKLISAPPLVAEQEFSRRDTILYALGVGAGIPDPLDPADLRFVLERGLLALPTMAVVLGWSDAWINNPEYGIDPRMVLHGEQSLILHAPMPVEGRVRATLTVEDIFDKGPGRGAVLLFRREIEDIGRGTHLATSRQIVFVRGDGGFGGKSEGQPRPHPVPEDRDPDLTLDLPTRPEQALIYRLSGDLNPLHADPDFAKMAGFSRPILHGLCTYGVAGRAVLKLLCGNDPARLARLDGRFTAPVIPGETLRTEVWQGEAGRHAWRVRAVERNIVVLNNGLAEVRG